MSCIVYYFDKTINSVLRFVSVQLDVKGGGRSSK